jgi:hypothetical protein
MRLHSEGVCLDTRRLLQKNFRSSGFLEGRVYVDQVIASGFPSYIKWIFSVLTKKSMFNLDPHRDFFTGEEDEHMYVIFTAHPEYMTSFTSRFRLQSCVRVAHITNNRTKTLT